MKGQVMICTFSSCISFPCVAPCSAVITALAQHSYHGESEEAEEVAAVPLRDGDYSNGKANHSSAMILD